MKNLQRWQPRQGDEDESGWGVIVDGTLTSPQWIITPHRTLDDQDAMLIAATHNAAIEARSERSIVCSSLVNKKLEPIIQITIGPEVAQLTVRDARQHVTQLQESIEAAMSDSLLCRFVGDHVYHGRDGADAKKAIGTMLVMFRDFRQSFEDPIEGGQQ